MTVLPDEIWSNILDYIEPLDLVSSQRVSNRLLKLARDSPLWRNKVFEKAPSAAHSHATSATALSSLTGALGGLSIGEPSRRNLAGSNTTNSHVSSNSASNRARAVLEWDKSDARETVDWYSEYIARHAPLSTVWAEDTTAQPEVRGMALFGAAERVVGTLEDGSVGVWDISQPREGRRKPVQLGKSRTGLLYEDMYSLGECSLSTKGKPLGATVENISVDSKRKRAFCAVENSLNEIDLERMEIISQNKFAWPITALSQESNNDSDLTVGTSFSLHIHDSRLLHLRPTDQTERVDVSDDSKIAFLQNYSKGLDMRIHDEFEASADVLNDYRYFTHNKIEAFARLEPGPQSIVHRGENDIVIAGRMPSILFYDRRNFPSPRTAIHSGARLSAMTVLDVPPSGAGSSDEEDSTLIVCGEYGGRGSLEIYQLPWEKRTSPRTSAEEGNTAERTPSNTDPFSFKNRQEASSSKLLSVITQGTRIVFSDSEGTLKWVERDGRGMVRRWNINAFRINERGASLSGDKVVRKMIALPEEQTGRGMRGDGDILVWTGERIGVVTTKPKPWDDHDELVQAFERGMDLNDKNGEKHEKEREMQYSTMMRQALERQADERRWMSRFGMRRG